MATLMPTAVDVLNAQLFKAQANSPRNNPSLSGNIDNLIDALLASEGIIVGPYVFNVRNPIYGAKGDGVTDDTVAIQLAIAAAEAVGGVVFFPIGTYKITAALVYTSNVTLAGSGVGSIIRANLTTPLIKGAVATTRYYSVYVRDLLIDNTSAANAGSVAVDFNNVSVGAVERCNIQNVETAIRCNVNGAGNGAYYNNFIGNICSPVVNGISLAFTGGAAAGPNENRVIGNRFTGTGIGYLADSTSNGCVLGTSFEGFATGISTSPTSACQNTGFLNARTEGCTTAYQIGALDQGLITVSPSIIACGTAFAGTLTNLIVESPSYNSGLLRVGRLILGPAGSTAKNVNVYYDNASGTLLFRSGDDLNYMGIQVQDATVRGTLFIGALATSIGAADSGGAGFRVLRVPN